MFTSIDSQLNETLRDALVAYYLDEVVTHSPKLIELGLNTQIKDANDIYQFLLLDVQVSQNVNTSYVACAISSLQQYVNSILMGLEPGYETKAMEAYEIEQWRDQQSQYPIWAANQQLAWYPEIYIDPSLRLKKSDDFRQLENDINQNNIEVDTVQEAVKAYLSNFEQVANLSIINGYITTDDFANGTYYFIGKSRSESGYYWRSVDMSQRSFKQGADGPKFDNPQPGAWSGWKKADLPISENGLEHTIRPVYFNNRLFVSWLEHIPSDNAAHEVAPGEGPEVKSRSLVRMNMVYKKYDDSWSAPHNYLSWHTDAKPEDLKSIVVQDSASSLFIAMYAGYKNGSKADGSADTYSLLKSARIDRSFNAIPLFPRQGVVPDTDTSAEKKLHVLKVGRLFALTNEGAGRFQFRMPALEISVKSVDSVSAHASKSDWSYLTWQTKIAGPLKDRQVRYDRNRSTLEFHSELTGVFQQPEKNIRIVHRGLLVGTTTFDLFIEGNPTGTAARIMPGSTVTVNHEWCNDPENLYKLNLINISTGKSLDAILQTTPGGKSFKLPALRAGTHPLTAGFIDLHALNEILKSPIGYNASSIEKTTPKSVVSQSIDLLLTTVGINPNSLNFRHHISRPKVINPKATAWPEDFSNNHVRLIERSHVDQLTPPDTLILSVPINEDTLRPDWAVEWPVPGNEGPFIPFIHGVVVRSGEKLLGNAVKGLLVELELLPATNKSLIAPKINTRHSDSLGTVEFIDFAGSDIDKTDGSTTLDRAPLRMNTLFARELIERANIALENLLSWETQGLPEPPMLEKDTGTSDVMDFHGANGLYFWELFLHLPFLVSHRLNLEHDFAEAERWLGFIFDPSRKADSNTSRPAFWNVRPLVEEKTLSGYSIQAATDPDGIAASHPIRYQKAIYSHYLKNLIDQGDAAYRQLTPDSLGEAKLWYVRVLDLLGNRPDVKMVDHWTPVTLQRLSTDTSQKLRDFEIKLNHQDRLSRESEHEHGVSRYSFAEPPLRLGTFAIDPTLSEIDNPYLRLPINFKLVALWDTLESRLSNLRNNRTLDGKPLSLPLFAAPLDPRDVLSAFGQGATGAKGSRTLKLDIPHYRFSVMHSRANAAVETLMQFGHTLLSLVERKEQAEMLELQHQQAWDFALFAIDLQKQELKVAEESRLALLASRHVVESRLSFYSERSDEVVSAGEVAAGVAHLVGRNAEKVSAVANIVGSALKTVPNHYGVIAGLANGVISGGWRLEGPAEMASSAAAGVAAASHGIGEALDRVEQYRRRHQEWVQARDQSQLEVAQIDAQLKVLEEQEKVTALQLRQAQTALEQARITYAFLGKRFTKSQLYQWLNGQLATFYYQVYDATLSLCLAAEACWQYELADFSTRFIQTSAWNDAYRGLTAGESLKLNLLKMDSAYLTRNDRSLEITKTVSLRQLLAKDPASALNKDWETVYEKLMKDGSVDFELTHNMFDNDYPGQYCRRIKRISVSLPVTLGPYEDIRATLTQTYNKVELHERINGTVRENLRASQQIALSSGVDDDGMFTLSFDDERYLPFEGTGAISRWSLQFPNPADQQAILASLTDIIVHVQYTSKTGTGA